MGGIMELLEIGCLLFILLLSGNGHCRGKEGEKEHPEGEVLIGDSDPGHHGRCSLLRISVGQ